MLREGEEDGDRVGVLLVLGVEAVVLLLAELQTLGRVVHDVDDGDQRDENDDPLFAGDGADAGDRDADPEEDLGEVVRAADDLEEAGVAETMRVLFLRSGLLTVCGGFADDGERHDDDADPGPDIVFALVDDTVGDRGGLCRVEEHHDDPHDSGHEDGRPLGGAGGLEGLLVVGVLQLSSEKVSAEAPAVDDEQHGQDAGGDGQGAVDEAEDEVEQTDAHDGKAVADGHEPDELKEAHETADGGEDENGPHKGRPCVTDISGIEMEHYLSPPK